MGAIDSEIYYILQPGAEKEHGPYSLRQLARMWENETVSAETLYATREMEGWESVEMLHDLFPSQEIAEPPRIERTLDDVYRTMDQQTIKRAQNQMGLFATICVAGVVLFSLLVVIGAIAGSNGTPEEKADSRKSDAYDYTRAVIRDRYPGVKEFLRYGVSRAGNTYRVTTVVDGLNAFGGPVRPEFNAKLEWSESGGWTLVELKQN